MIRFRVNGVPAPQGSKRHVGGGRMVESSKAVGPWREAVRAEAQRAIKAMLQEGLILHKARDAVYAFLADPETGDRPGVSVTVVFVLARPKSHYTRPGLLTKAGAAQKYPAKRPDVDKLARAVLDGLVAGGVMADDSQVVSLNCAKVYAGNGETPGAIIEVEAMK